MIDPAVSRDIELVLVNDSCVSEYAALAAKDYDYLAEWLQWPRFCKSESDFRKFVDDSVSAFRAGESMNCAIKYKGAVAGVAGYNSISQSLKRVEIGNEEKVGDKILDHVIYALYERDL